MEERPRVAVRTGRISSWGFPRSQPLRKGTRSDSEQTSKASIGNGSETEPSVEGGLLTTPSNVLIPKDEVIEVPLPPLSLDIPSSRIGGLGGQMRFVNCFLPPTP